MNVLKRYTDAIERGDMNDDPQQRQVLKAMQRLADELHTKSLTRWLKKSHSPKGLYIYGPVGTGKTTLMDLFYQASHEPKKARFHFHEFMQYVDNELRQLQGRKNPLRYFASHLAKKVRLLCLDECLVNDIAHAMILSELLQALFSHGIILLTTSNTPPDALYANGIQRQRFLPTIDILKTHCEIISLEEKHDYRQHRKPLDAAFICPLGEKAERFLQKEFEAISQAPQKSGSLTVQNRPIHFVQCSDKAIWFTFNVICNIPRSQLDYLEIAERFDTVFVSDIPVLGENELAQIILFIHFIDVMYDRGIVVVMSADVPVNQIYTHGELFEVFQRTQSRLYEMQSVDYLKRHPRKKNAISDSVSE